MWFYNLPKYKIVMKSMKLSYWSLFDLCIMPFKLFTCVLFRLKQKAQQEQAVQDTLHELSKPLARYKDDKDLDQMMREQDRAGDPMLAFIKKKKKPEKEGKGKIIYLKHCEKKKKDIAFDILLSVLNRCTN